MSSKFEKLARVCGWVNPQPFESRSLRVPSQHMVTSEHLVRCMMHGPTPECWRFSLINAHSLANHRHTDVFCQIQANQTIQDSVAENPDVEQCASDQPEHTDAEVPSLAWFHGFIMVGGRTVGQMTVRPLGDTSPKPYHEGYGIGSSPPTADGVCSALDAFRASSGRGPLPLESPAPCRSPNLPRVRNRPSVLSGARLLILCFVRSWSGISW